MLSPLRRVGNLDRIDEALSGYTLDPFSNDSQELDKVFKKISFKDYVLNHMYLEDFEAQLELLKGNCESRNSKLYEFCENFPLEGKFIENNDSCKSTAAIICALYLACEAI